MKKIWRYLLIILAVLFGIGCILGGLTLLLGINRVIAVVTQYKLPLISPSSQLWDPFIDPSRKGITPQRYIYIYNITNPEDVCQGQIPNLVERGPYVYVRQRRKIEDTLYITPDKEYIEFQYEDQFIFNSSASVDATTGDVLLESDTFVFYNVALLVAAYRVRNMDTSVGPLSIGWIPTIVINRAVTECVSTTEDSDIGVLLHLSVQQYLWGYVDPLLVRVQKLSKLTPDEPYSSTTSQVLFNKSIPAPDIIDPKRGQRCPLWEPQSECLTSTNSFSRVSTGYSNLTTVGQMKKFNGRENMPWWTGECAHFNGSTDGTQFQPQLTENTRPLLFVDALARTLELSYVGSSEVKGIKTLRFSMAPETFQSAKINPRNACFNQTIDGFLNLEPVLFAPLLVSQPYFLEADTSGVSFSFNNVTDGMVNRANKEQHAARIDIEPTSGAPMYLRVGVQINIPAGPIPKTEGGTDYYRETVPLHKSLVPAVLMYDQVEVSDQLVEEISKELSLGVIAHQIGGPFLIASGGLALLVALIAICFPRIFCRCCQNSEISKKPEGTVQNSDMVRVSINEHKKGVEAPPPKRYEALVKSRKYEKKGERH